MSRRNLLLVPAILLFIAIFAFAQYTGFDIERKEPESLYPQAGPGARAILQEIRQTNDLLEQNNQLLTEQNKLFREFLARTPKK